MVPTEGVEAAQRFLFVFACFCNCLQERMLRSQNQNAEILSKRTKTKRNEQKLSAIVIKKRHWCLKRISHEFRKRGRTVGSPYNSFSWLAQRLSLANCRPWVAGRLRHSLTNFAKLRRLG